MTFTSYEIGRVKTFLQPRVCVMTVVFVVTKVPGDFLTLVVSFVCVFLKENTLLGARSRGFKVRVVPLTSSVSTISVVFSSVPSVSEEVLEVRLDMEFELRPELVDLSISTSADRTSRGNEFHAWTTEVERVAEPSLETSLLLRIEAKKAIVLVR